MFKKIGSDAPVIIYRTLYFMLLILACVEWYFELLPPSDGGEPGPGDGIVLLLNIFLMTFLGLPMCFVLWAKGFNSVRLRTLILLLGIAALELPVLFVILAICKAAILRFNIF